ncbi:MAG: esterase/lipase family protein [Planctomycetaceae bacterium]
MRLAAGILCAVVVAAVAAAGDARAGDRPAAAEAAPAVRAKGGFGGLGLPKPPEDPRAAAEGHLRRAREAFDASVKMAKDGQYLAMDGFYVACEEAWNAVWSCPGDREILQEAAWVYADALAGFLETACARGRLRPEGVWVGPRSKPVLVPFAPKALPLDPALIGSIESARLPDDRRLTRRITRAGFGLPVVVRVKEPAGGRDAASTSGRQSLAATAVLRFRMPGDENFLETFAGPAYRDHAAAVLDLANPVEVAAVKIGPARPHLAADLTAPLLDILAAKPRTSAVEGFIQPFGRGDTRPRLELLEPHRPGRIPVVFIHGLASDEGTWFDMINELRGWPEFHRRFEPWVYQYPTGAAFLMSAAALRRELAQAAAELDPDGVDPALRQMVLVGHSMGGLHAKVQASSAGTAIWDAIAWEPFDRLRLPPAARGRMAEAYFFEAAPHVTRIVCIATPHRGSILASLGVGRAASLAVKSPPEAQAVHDAAVTLNPGAFKPDFAKRVPTTIDMLEPSSGLLHAIEGLRPACWVAVHSVVGTGHLSVTGGRDDCVVSEASAHTAGARSEIAVPATHTKVHHHPDTIREVQRILAEHVRECGAEK